MLANIQITGGSVWALLFAVVTVAAILANRKVQINSVGTKIKVGGAADTARPDLTPFPAPAAPATKTPAPKPKARSRNRKPRVEN
jgi:hypothetical protein